MLEKQTLPQYPMLSLDSHLKTAYQKLLDRIYSPAWLMDESGKICLMNTSWNNMMGALRSLQGEGRLWDVIEKDTQEDIEVDWKHRRLSEATWTCNLWLKQKNGDNGLFKLELERLTDQGEISSLWIGSAIPILEREFQNTFSFGGSDADATPDPHAAFDIDFLAMNLQFTKTAAWQWNLKTQQLSWTPEFSALVGYEKHKTTQLYEEWLDHIHPADKALVQATLENVIKQKLSDYSYEYRLQELDGFARSIKSCIKLRLDAEGQPRWILGSAYDITERHLEETTLRRNAEFVRRILESNQDCIKVLNLEGRLLYMNDGGQALMEIDDFKGQAQNSLWLNFWQDAAHEAAKQAFNAACVGKSGKFDGFCATAKGTPKWWEVLVTPIYGADNEVEEILSVSRDITARKSAEHALQERNRELDQFAHIVSHDLKAPLRGIINLSQWLEDDLTDHLSTEMQHNLDLLRQRVQRMNALIDGLLQFSRVGRQELPMEWVNVADLLKEVIDSLSPPVGFQIVIAKSLPTFFAKRLLLSQVLANLISNAIKHHDKDTGTIQIAVEDFGSHYQFTVADDGPGIPDADQTRVFEIFQTLSHNHSATNTGIGLALVQKIVLGEGGIVWVDHYLSKGCQFCFTWPKRTVTGEK